jgi:hypothetical protein
MPMKWKVVPIVALVFASWSLTQTKPLPVSPRSPRPAQVAPQDRPIVYVAPAMVRIGRDEARSGPVSVTLWAGQGEYEAFQIVLNGGEKGIHNGTVSVSDLKAPDGAVISRANAALYREHYVLITSSSPDQRGTNRPLPPGWYADALIPFWNTDGSGRMTALAAAAPFVVEARRNQPVWVDWYVPPGSRAGTYFGTAFVSTDRGTVNIPITLTVWHFALPRQPSLRSSFGMHEPYASDPRAQEVLLRHKLMPFMVSAGKTVRLRDLGLNIIGLPFFSGSNRSRCTMDLPPATAEIAAQAARFVPGLPNYIYSADEIDPCLNLFDTVKQWARHMHAAGVRNLATITPTPLLYDDGAGTGRSAVDIWVVTGAMYDSAPGRVAQVLRKGDEVWSYTALVQDSYSPKWEIDFAPINYRIQPGFMSQSLGLTGLLYWRVDSFTSRPWTDVRTYVENGMAFPGEGMLVYPGDQVGLTTPVPSMRLKWLREGVEDYEFIELAKSRGLGDWALSMSRTVAADWTNWTRDVTRLEAARLQIGQKLDDMASR